MAITSALVLFAVIWFLVLFVVLPVGLRTQGDEDDVVPGTPASSPANLNLGRKLWIVTGISAVLFVVIAGIIISEWITVEDLDVFRPKPPSDGIGG